MARLFLVAGMFGMFFFLTQFLQDVLGYDPLQTGLAFLPFSVALFVMSQLSARRLIERFGGKPLMVAGISLSTLAMLLMTQLSASSTYLFVLIPVLLFGTPSVSILLGTPLLLQLHTLRAHQGAHDDHGDLSDATAFRRPAAA